MDRSPVYPNDWGEDQDSTLNEVDHEYKHNSDESRKVPDTVGRLKSFVN